MPDRIVVVEGRDQRTGRRKEAELLALDDTIECVKATLSRVDLPDGQLAEIIVSASFDNGQTWQVMQSGRFGGGKIFKDGVEEIESFLGFTWEGEYELDKDGKNVLDGNGQPIRTPIKGTDIKIEVNVLKDFSSDIKLEALTDVSKINFQAVR